MPPKFNTARESAAPYNRAARRSLARAAATPSTPTPQVSAPSTTPKTPSPVRTVISPPSTPPSPSPTRSTSTASVSRKRRHSEEDEQVEGPINAAVKPASAKKRRSEEPQPAAVVVVVEQVAPLPSPPLSSTSSDLEAAVELSSASPSLSSSPCSPASSASMPSSPSADTHSTVSTAPSSPVQTSAASSRRARSASASVDSVSSTASTPSAKSATVLAHSPCTNALSAGPTSRSISVQTEAIDADDLEMIVALRTELDKSEARVVELECERREKAEIYTTLQNDLTASQATAELYRNNSEELVAEGNATFARLQSELEQRTIERDETLAKFAELESTLEQVRAQAREVEAGRLANREHAEQAVKELSEAHSRELAAITAKHEAEIAQAKAYFEQMTAEQEALKHAKEAAEAAIEQQKQTAKRTKEVLHGLGAAVQALDPPLPCTICASLLLNLDHLGSETHIPSARCAVPADDAPRIHIPASSRNMRIVEMNSDDESGSDDGSDSDDNMFSSDSSDDDAPQTSLFIQAKRAEAAAAARRARQERDAGRPKRNAAPQNSSDDEDDDSDDSDSDSDSLIDLDRDNASDPEGDNLEDFFLSANSSLLVSPEEVLDGLPVLRECGGAWVRVERGARMRYEDGKLSVMRRPPRGMFVRVKRPQS
ncbi:hypothetical protein JCM10908_000288 [Rhodotorula pacifica]|uniref:uncharacterized protein n=1 Tax=Rhodotorula pacifica TaxID=1495444 RepID=UPI003170C1A0